MKFTPAQAQTLDAVMRWRRDVRHFRSEPVNDTQLARLRAAFDLAPSVGNARPWRVLRVRDTHLRAAVRAEFQACNTEAAGSYDNAARAEYMNLKLAGLDEAPEHLAVFTETNPVEGRTLGRRTMPETLQQSTAMAMHGMWLMARAENLGVGMVSILRPEMVARIFEVPESWHFAAYLCVGHPAFDDDTPLLHREGWQENLPSWWAER